MHQNNNIKRNTSMKRNYNELFQTKVENYKGLENNIIRSINVIKYRNMLIKQIFYILVSVISLSGLVYSSKYVFELIIDSGIYEYISLIFVNTEVLTYWKELSYSIIESMPFLELSILMSLISIFVWSIKKVSRIQIIRSSYLQTN